jgi:hypothetical protein
MDDVSDIGEEIELLADDDRPGAFLLLLDRVRQSYVDLGDPTYLEFPYVRAFADVLRSLPPGELDVLHVGGGALTLGRWLAVARPGCRQLVLEPYAAVTEFVRRRLPYPRGFDPEIRPVDGRSGLADVGTDSMDVVVLDAFAGGRVPADVTTAEFFAEVDRVLRPAGVVMINAADGPPLAWIRRLITTVAGIRPEILLLADSVVLTGADFGNIVVVAAAPDVLPVDLLLGEPEPDDYERLPLAGGSLRVFTAGALPLTDASSSRSPEPPEELWRVSGVLD